MPPNKALKLLRHKRKLTVRDVEQASRRIAEAKGDKRFSISNGRLVQLENGHSEPSICKIFSLAAIYGVSFAEIARLYDVDLDEIEKYVLIANPHLTQLGAEPHQDLLQHLDTGAVTCLMPRPVSAARASNLLHGYIGLNDYTMSPLIKPGAIVEIDCSQDKFQIGSRNNEFERPIFFIELRDGYACGWCELQDGQLVIVPHPLSPAKIRSFAYRREAGIVGRVVAYTTRCMDE